MAGGVDMGGKDSSTAGCEAAGRAQHAASDAPAADAAFADTQARHAPLGAIARIVQAGFIFEVLIWLAYAAFTQGSEFPYDLHACAIFFLIPSSAICSWLLGQRARAAKPAIIATTAVNLAFSTVQAFQNAAASAIGPSGIVVALVLEYAVSAAVIAYFMRSKHMRKVLVRSLGRTPEEQEAARAARENGGEEPVWPKHSWSWWRNLLIYYFAFTVIGHWAEMAFCQLIRLGIVGGTYDASNHIMWDEWLYPYRAEGVAIILIVALLYPLKVWLTRKCNGKNMPAFLLSFLANAIACTSIDFITGITANGDHHMWDYSDLPFNFMGQICLQNSLTYSLAATLIVWFVYPAMDKLVHRPSEAVMDTIFVGMFAFYAFLELMYFVYIGPQGVVLG